VKQRLSMVNRKHSLSVRRQANLLQIHRSRLYYKPLGESAKNLELMEIMDRLCLADPTLGVIGMQDELAERGRHYNAKRIRRLLRLMGYEAIYPKRNLSRLARPNTFILTSYGAWILCAPTRSGPSTSPIFRCARALCT
jgi:putative transposase